MWRRLTIAFSALILIFGGIVNSSSSFGNDTGVMGDLDCDGVIDIGDAIVSLRFSSGIPPSPAICKDNEATGDGKIDLGDAVYILQVTAGMRVRSIEISPLFPSVPIGATIQFEVIGTDDDGTIRNVTQRVNWLSSDAAIALISQGSARGLNSGTTVVAAKLGALSSATTLTVIPVTESGVIKSLAKGEFAGNIYLSNDRIYFNEYNRKEVLSVSKIGGRVVTHVYEPFVSPGRIAYSGGKIFILDTSSGGGLYSIPNSSEGIARISNFQESNYNATDLVVDKLHAYWAEYSGSTENVSKVLRTDVITSSATPLNAGKSTDLLLNSNQAGKYRLALDNEYLFVSEGLTGDINKVDLRTGASNKIIIGLVSGECERLYGIPLFITKNGLYVVLNCEDVFRIDKNNGNPLFVRKVPRRDVRADEDYIYWWEDNYPNILLNKYDSQQDSISTVTSAGPFLSGYTEIYDFHPDGYSIWWFNEHYYHYPKVQFQRVSRDGGLPELLEIYDPDIYGVERGMQPNGLIGDSDFLYWYGPYNSIFKLPKTGGLPVLLTRKVDTVARTIRISTEYLVFNDSRSIKMMPKAGLTDLTVEWTNPVDNSMPMELAIDSTNIYWFVDRYISDNDSNITTLFSKSLSDGEVKEIDTFYEYGKKIVSYGNSLFLGIHNWHLGETAIIELDKAMGSKRILFRLPNANSVDLYVNNNVLYILRDGFLYSYELDSDTLPALLGPPGCSGVYVDDVHVYCTTASGVRRMPLAGGAAEYIYTGCTSNDIEGDAERIYWAACSDGILSRKK